jgi:hypothetical protein
MDSLKKTLIISKWKPYSKYNNIPKLYRFQPILKIDILIRTQFYS